MQALPESAIAPPRVHGIDDFALRRGHHYGIALTDLERRRVVAVLPDRTTDTFVTWLKEYGQPAIICRDRGGDHASGARQGTLAAIQIADRFHLVRTSSDVLKRLLARHPAALRSAVAEATAPPADTADIAVARPDPRRERHLARYDRVAALHRVGWSVTAIGREIGVCRETVRRYLRAERFPEGPDRRTRFGDGTTHGAFLQAR